MHHCVVYLSFIPACDKKRRSIESSLNLRCVSLSAGDEENFMEERRASDAALAPPESDVFSLAPHRQPVSSRIRRSAGKISDICCEKGCSMKELIQFC